MSDVQQTPTDRYEDLRATFLGFLTVDSETQDRRRKDHNQAIFMTDEHYYGEPVWSRTTLDMVMEKFDKAVKVVLDA